MASKIASLIFILWNLWNNIHFITGRQLIDSKGTDFVIGFLTQHVKYQVNGSNQLYLTSDETTTVHLQIPFIQRDQQITLTPGIPRVVDLPGKIRMESKTGYERKGIRLRSRARFSVFGINIVERSSDGFLGLPVVSLGSDYVISTYKPIMSALVLIVSPGDQTSVTVQLRISDGGEITFSKNRYRDGESFTFPLDSMQCFQIVSDPGHDLTGTRVTSAKPVAVFSGNDCAYVPFNKRSCDHLVEQILPVSMWGKEFVTMPTAIRTGGDFFHILAAEHNTVVTVDFKKAKTLQSGHKYELSASSGVSHIIRTSKPSLVVQYAKGHSVDGSLFDPFMAVLPSTNQYSNDYTVSVPVHGSRQFTSFVSIVSKTTHLQGIKIKPINSSNSILRFSQCAGIHGTNFSSCSVQLSHGSYRIYHDSPPVTFALNSYGTWKRESYGFPGGIRISRATPNCVESLTIPADGNDNDCDGRIDEELSNGVDDDGDGRIDEDLATIPPSLTLPRNASLVSCTNIMLDTETHGEARGEAFGICKVRGPVATTYKDVLVSKTECGYTLVRSWKLTDACTNTKYGNQYFTVSTPTRPTVQFPTDLTLTCRTQKYLVPERTGNVKILRNSCKGHVKIQFRDSLMSSCLVKKRILKREWTVIEECGRQMSKVQMIHLVPLERRQRTRMFNASLPLLSESFTADLKDRTSDAFNEMATSLEREVDKALLTSYIGDYFLGSKLVYFRPGSVAADILLMFDVTSKVMPRDILDQLKRAALKGMLGNFTLDPKRISVQDFNECNSVKYNFCDKNAACRNTEGSYNCSCVGRFIGDGTACQALPLITTQPSHIEGAVEENITLQCQSHGIPAPNIYWVTPRGKKINRTRAVHMTELLDDMSIRTRLQTVQRDGSLLITDARVSDSGVFTCIATNSLGTDDMKVKLTVRKDRVVVDASITLVEEKFENNLKNKTSARYRQLEEEVKRELSAVFVGIDGFQQVNIIAFMNGSVKVLFRVVVKVDNLEMNPPQLTVRRVGETLRVKVKSGYIGKLKVSQIAEIRGRPPPPFNITLSDLKYEAVHVWWIPPDLHDMYGVATYSLQYKEFGDNINIWNTFATVPTHDHRLSGLESVTSYIVRVKANNKYGGSEPSELLEITTLRERSMIEWLVLILVPVLVLVLIIILIVFTVRRLKKRRNEGLYDPGVQEEIAMTTLQPENKTLLHTFRTRVFTFKNEDHYSGAPTKNKTRQEQEGGLAQGLDASFLWREIPRDRITLGDVIGEGEFGLVIKSTFTDDDGEELPCAVKKLKRSATETDFKDLLNELEIMTGVGSHENIINLFGACSVGGPLLIVVELAEFGNLLRYLRNHRQQNYDNMNEYTLSISSAERLRFACEISKGMAHLAWMKCAHRDLAARNVLLGENLTAKVADFGLSRDVYTDNVYEKKTGGKLPAKWMPLESLEFGIYTSQSDVWSFGVVLWEIETGGVTPFSTLSVSELMEYLKAGRRLGRPIHCNRSLYSIMLRCWNANPERRSTFEVLLNELKDLYRQETIYVNVKGISEEDANENQRLA